MFTGIIEEIGRVLAVEELEGGRRFRFGCTFADALRVDESVAVDGACLTVVANDAEAFEAVAVEETLRKTALGERQPGDGVNLERALVLGSRLDGHLVQGHVDATGEIVEVETLADSHEVTVRYPSDFAAYLIPKGSVTVDGISLTVAALDAPAGTFRRKPPPAAGGRANVSTSSSTSSANMSSVATLSALVRRRPDSPVPDRQAVLPLTRRSSAFYRSRLPGKPRGWEDLEVNPCHWH